MRQHISSGSPLERTDRLARRAVVSGGSPTDEACPCRFSSEHEPLVAPDHMVAVATGRPARVTGSRKVARNGLRSSALEPLAS
jgi:hypothetical protein